MHDGICTPNGGESTHKFYKVIGKTAPATEPAVQTPSLSVQTTTDLD